MIQITLHDNDPLTQLIAARAAQSGRDKGAIATEVIHEGFLTLIRALHEQHMRGEISQGTMAEQLGIGRSDLIHLLDAMGLQISNL